MTERMWCPIRRWVGWVLGASAGRVDLSAEGTADLDRCEPWGALGWKMAVVNGVYPWNKTGTWIFWDYFLAENQRWEASICFNESWTLIPCSSLFKMGGFDGLEVLRPDDGFTIDHGWNLSKKEPWLRVGKTIIVAPGCEISFNRKNRGKQMKRVVWVTQIKISDRKSSLTTWKHEPWAWVSSWKWFASFDSIAGFSKGHNGCHWCRDAPDQASWFLL